MSAMAEELASQAEQLQQMMEFFHVDNASQLAKSERRSELRNGSKIPSVEEYISKRKEEKETSMKTERQERFPLFEMNTLRPDEDEHDTDFERF